MRVPVRIREVEDPFSDGKLHGEIDTSELDTLFDLFRDWGVVADTGGDFLEMHASGQFVFRPASNEVYFEIAFGAD